MKSIIVKSSIYSLSKAEVKKLKGGQDDSQASTVTIIGADIDSM
ncbi:MAG: hypothetical protein AAGG75_13645 [Bacteroidota bacterium]